MLDYENMGVFGSKFDISLVRRRFLDPSVDFERGTDVHWKSTLGSKNLGIFDGQLFFNQKKIADFQQFWGLPKRGYNGDYCWGINNLKFFTPF